MERGQWAHLARMPGLNPYFFSEGHPVIFNTSICYGSINTVLNVNCIEMLTLAFSCEGLPQNIQA